MEMANDFSVLDLCTGALVTFQRFCIIKYVHAHGAVGKLLIRMPGVQMHHQVVFLVEMYIAYKASQLRFLVLGLDVGKKKVSLREFFPTLRARKFLHLLAVLLRHVLLIQPLLLEYFVAVSA